MGWARANLYIETIDRLPPPGSPMDLLLLSVWVKRQDIDFQKSRSVLQALLNQQGAAAETIQKAFKDLRSSFFPYEEGKKDKEKEEMKKALEREQKRGPVAITPMETPHSIRRRSVHVNRGIVDQQHRQKLENEGRLRRMDHNPVGRAKRRGRPGSGTAS